MRKIIVLGEPKSGKSWLLQRYVNDAYSDSSPEPFDSLSKTVTYQDNKTQKAESEMIQLWDYHQGDYRKVSYFRNISGIVLTVDLTDKDAVAKAEEHIAGIQQYAPDNTPIILVGTKSDGSRAVGQETLTQLAIKNGLLGPIETSAKYGVNVEESFNVLIDAIINPKSLSQIKRPNQGKMATQSPAKVTMNYNELACADRNTAKRYEQKFNAENATMSLENGTFATFTSKAWTRSDKDAANHNWKIHISINKDHLASAWDLIYPILISEYVGRFKVVNLARNTHAETQAREKLQEAEGILSKLEKKEFDLTEMKGLATRCAPELDKYKHFIDDENKLRDFLIALFKIEKIPEYRNGVEEVLRTQLGFQVTIYIKPGDELRMRAVMDKVEKKLQLADIPAGSIHQSDRRIGQYCSVRHTGEEYQDGVTVANYNPDNISDPFSVLLNFRLVNEAVFTQDQLTQLQKTSPEILQVLEKAPFDRVKALSKDAKDFLLNTTKSIADRCNILELRLRTEVAMSEISALSANDRTKFLEHVRSVSAPAAPSSFLQRMFHTAPTMLPRPRVITDNIHTKKVVLEILSKIQTEYSKCADANETRKKDIVDSIAKINANANFIEDPNLFLVKDLTSGFTLKGRSRLYNALSALADAIKSGCVDECEQDVLAKVLPTPSVKPGK